MPFNSGALIMSEGAPEFHEQRGVFVLTVPVGKGHVRIGFLPHDFITGCVEGRKTADDFFARQTGVKKLRA